MLVAIDGPAGAGKSTVARLVAAELGFAYLDTGAMYRAVAFLEIESAGRSSLEHADIAKAVAGRVEVTESGRVMVEGRDLTERIRAAEVTEATPQIAKVPAVRAALVERQRRLIAQGDWVVEGRDIGTVVAPDAEVKVFLVASPEERARRRAAESGADPQSVFDDLARRDALDAARDRGVLKAAPGAVTIDATSLTLEEVVGHIVELARTADTADRATPASGFSSSHRRDPREHPDDRSVGGL